MMMRVPMVSSQSLHNGYVKYGRLLRSSGLSSGSVISRPEKFVPQVTPGAPLGASDPRKSPFDVGVGELTR